MENKSFDVIYACDSVCSNLNLTSHTNLRNYFHCRALIVFSETTQELLGDLDMKLILSSCLGDCTGLMKPQKKSAHNCEGLWPSEVTKSWPIVTEEPS